MWGHGPDTLACKARPSFDGHICVICVMVSVSGRRPNRVCPGLGIVKLGQQLPQITRPVALHVSRERSGSHGLRSFSQEMQEDSGNIRRSGIASAGSVGRLHLATYATEEKRQRGGERENDSLSLSLDPWPMRRADKRSSRLGQTSCQSRLARDSCDTDVCADCSCSTPSSTSRAEPKASGHRDTFVRCAGERLTLRHRPFYSSSAVLSGRRLSFQCCLSVCSAVSRLVYLPCLALVSPILFCLALSGFVWHCLASLGLVWLCLAFSDE